MRFARIHAIALALTATAIAAPLVAQRGPMMRGPAMHGAGAPGDVTAGTYAAEPYHTQVSFTVSHFGITPYVGTFANATGTLVLDPANLAAAKLSISIPTASVTTTSDRLTGELKSADWLDTGKFPAATFVSSSITQAGPESATVQGTLTLHGVSKPVTIMARFYGTGTNPMSKKVTIGFTGRATINRSEFGVSKYAPMVSDETTLTIAAAFEKQ